MVRTRVSIPKSETATMPMSFKRRSEMTNVTIHMASFAAVHLASSRNFRFFQKFGSAFCQATAARVTSEAKTTSNIVMAKGETLATTKPMAIEENALRIQETASTAQYLLTESERKSTENPTIAKTAASAETNETAEEFEKMKNPATMVRSLPVSEYGARTQARSWE